MRTRDGAILGAVLLAGCQRTAPEPAASEAAATGEVTLASFGEEGTPRAVLDLLAELQRVSFGGGSAGLSPTTKGALTRAARVLQANPRLRVEVQGYDDEGATDDRPLGLDRARAVRDYLESRGVDTSRVIVADLADGGPRQGRTKHVWSLNRRVQFRVLWDQELAFGHAGAQL